MWAVAILAAIAGIPVWILFVEVIGALLPVRCGVESFPEAEARGSLCVVVPAHNESSGLVPTLEDVQAQLTANDRLLVVADNCTDDTAGVARAAGAEVVIRDDPQRIGKGFAMSWGIAYLKQNPPSFVLFVDADCRVAPKSIDLMMRACHGLGRPLQALYLMTASDNSSVNHSVAEFAWLLKNLVRPLGLKNLRCPVQLMGTGMMFPWEVIRDAPLASGSLVEDMKLGLDLAVLGNAPAFFPHARVTSEFPVTVSGTATQRQRWIQGHLTSIVSLVPNLLLQAAKRRDVGLLAMTLDLIVPPLTLLVLIEICVFLLSAAGAILVGSSAAVVVSSINLLVFLTALGLAWSRFARDVLPLRALPSICRYLVEKVVIYGKLLTGRSAKHWIRTDRKS